MSKSFLLLFSLFAKVKAGVYGAFIADLLHASEYNSENYFVFDLHAFSSNTSLNNYVTNLNEDSVSIDAITMYIYPAKFATISTNYSVAFSSDRTVAIIYSVNGMNTNEIARTFLYVNSTDNDWIDNLAQTRLEKVTGQDVIDIDWQNSSNLIFRDGLYPNHTECNLQIQSFDSISTISLSTQHFSDYTPSDDVNFIQNTTTNKYIIYNTSNFDSTFTNPIKYDFVNGNITTQSSTLAYGSNCESFRNMTGSSTCVDVDSMTSEFMNTTTSCANLNALTSLSEISNYCLGSRNTINWNATSMCCRCGGGAITLDTMVQSNSGELIRTNIIGLSKVTDEDIVVNDGEYYANLFIVDFHSTFVNMTCDNFTDDSNDFYGGQTLHDVLQKQFSNILSTARFSFSTTYLPSCNIKITFLQRNKNIAKETYHILNRLVPIVESQSIDLIEVHSVPIYQYSINASSLNDAYSQRTPTSDTCIFEHSVFAT